MSALPSPLIAGTANTSGFVTVTRETEQENERAAWLYLCLHAGYEARAATEAWRPACPFSYRLSRL